MACSSSPDAVPAKLHAELGRRPIDERSHGILLASGNDVVFGLRLLEHEPLRVNVVPRVAPIAQRIEVAEVKTLVETGLDAGKTPRDLARHERLAAYGRLVIEQDAVAGKEAVRFAVVDRDPIRIHLGGGIRRTRIERRGFSLRGLDDLTEHLRARCLIEPSAIGQTADPDRFEQPQRAERIRVRRVFGRLE